jgi:hypothetical protein
MISHVIYVVEIKTNTIWALALSIKILAKANFILFIYNGINAVANDET